MTYFAFGAQVSSNVDLGPLPETMDALPAVTLRHRQVSRLEGHFTPTTCYASQGRSLFSSLRRHAVQIRIGDTLQFSLHTNRGLVLCISTAKTTLEQIRYWFLQKVLPAYLLLRGGIEILHSSAVEVEGKIAAFLAPSGTGKSTLVHHFVSQGHALLADEHLVIAAGGATALPTIPYMRPYRKVECLGDWVDRYCSTAQPIHSFYLLERAQPEDDVLIEQLRGVAAAGALCTRQQFSIAKLIHTSAYSHVPANRFARLMQLASMVPVKRLHVPRSLNRLPDVYAAIRLDMDKESHLAL